MKSRSDQNEGFRMLEEFVCQAIAHPSVVESSPHQEAVRKYQLDLVVADPGRLSADLEDAVGRLNDRIAIGNGLTLRPCFTSLGPAVSDGGNGVLTFTLSVPWQTELSSAAITLRDWMIRNGVRRARASGFEIPLSASAPDDVAVIAQVLTQKARGGDPNEPL